MSRVSTLLPHETTMAIGAKLSYSVEWRFSATRQGSHSVAMVHWFVHILGLLPTESFPQELCPSFRRSWPVEAVAIQTIATAAGRVDPTDVRAVGLVAR